MTKHRTERRGNVCVFVAACLTVLMGVIAIAIDGGVLMDDRQKVQSSADASALAAAEQLFLNWQSEQGLDPTGKARDAALALAASNGYTNDGVASIITPNLIDSRSSGIGLGVKETAVHGVWVPPATGDYKGRSGYVEVAIQFNQKRHFGGIYGTENIPVRARAVAEGGWRAGRDGILVLDPLSSASLNVTGNGTMAVLGAPIIVNSKASDAATAVGGATVSSDKSIDITGIPGIGGSGTWLGTINSGVPPTPDPLAYLPEPSPSGMTPYNKVNVAGQRTVTINPGCYNGGIAVSGQATLIMNPGIYYMNGGGFSFTGQGNLVANGVMIVNAPSSNSDVININGTGSIQLSPPTTGIYRGISLWQVRSSTNSINITGNGGSSMTGTFYAAHGTLNVTGNGDNDVLGSQYISYQVKVNGGGTFRVNWDPNLVARTRIIRLVE